MKILNDHPAVLSDPKVLVLVDRLGSATVNLKVYFWYDGSIYNRFKIKSSLIRLVKQSFEKEGISMPDEAREIIFPDGVPVSMLEPPGKKLEQDDSPDTRVQEETTTKAEDGLANE